MLGRSLVSPLSSLNPSQYSEGINIRNMTKDDLQIVMGWAAKEGWNPGKYEVEPLYEADPKGYHLLEVKGKPVASLAIVRYNQNFAFLGLYIVEKKYRGMGYGKLLWDSTMSKYKDCPTIGLNGVITQVENYKKSGFSPTTLNTRWSGRLTKKLLENEEINQDVQISITNEFSFKSLTDYDGRIFSRPRTAFLSKWLTMPESHVFAAIDGDTLKGYGVISASEKDYKIAPLFADNESIARNLYVALCRCVGDQKSIQLDTNQNNPCAADLAKYFGLQQTFDTVRMYKGEPPQEEVGNVFGLTTLEIG